MTSLDDGYSPPRTLEQTRKLVQQDDVLLIFGTLGTPTNTAIHNYLNANRIPHKYGDGYNSAMILAQVLKQAVTI